MQLYPSCELESLFFFFNVYKTIFYGSQEVVNKFCMEYELINHNWEEESSEAEKRFTVCEEEADGQTEKVGYRLN